MRLSVRVLGWELIDLATGRDVVDDDTTTAITGRAEPGAWSADLTPAPYPFGFAPNDEPIPEWVDE
ncbi:MAG TPA: hypothetical protein VFL65_00800 [Jatrophihabitans sp.]|nr:hypothetical protein [Jatrophihabitans sp.]